MYTFDQVRDEIERLPKSINVYFWVPELDGYLPFPRYRTDSLPRAATFNWLLRSECNEALLEIVRAS